MANKHDRGDDDEPVPRIPRTVGFKLSAPALFRILLTGALLAMIVVARRPCADSVSTFVTNVDGTGSGSAAVQMPKPGTVDVPSTGSAGDYEALSPDMSEAELKAAIERARAKARAANPPTERGETNGSSGSARGSGSGSN
ncbi:MAG TPA: hypothetical protein VK427_10760 [Kofleriaceae bacterium]|nr:hypothetical protein [Kofleriaceae bacterium]